MTVTFVAFGPLGPLSASKVTFAPSASDLKPLPAMPVWCTNRSLPWSSGVMKPKPFSSLNHFTVPVAILSSREVCAGEAREVRRATTTKRGHCLRRTPLPGRVRAVYPHPPAPRLSSAARDRRSPRCGAGALALAPAAPLLERGLRLAARGRLLPGLLAG